MGCKNAKSAETASATTGPSNRSSPRCIKGLEGDPILSLSDIVDESAPLLHGSSFIFRYLSHSLFFDFLQLPTLQTSPSLLQSNDAVFVDLRDQATSPLRLKVPLTFNSSSSNFSALSTLLTFKTVIAITDADSTTILQRFFEALRQSQAKPLRIYALQRGFDLFLKNQRYNWALLPFIDLTPDPLQAATTARLFDAEIFNLYFKRGGVFPRRLMEVVPPASPETPVLPKPPPESPRSRNTDICYSRHSFKNFSLLLWTSCTPALTKNPSLFEVIIKKPLNVNNVLCVGFAKSELEILKNCKIDDCLINFVPAALDPSCLAAMSEAADKIHQCAKTEPLLLIEKQCPPTLSTSLIAWFLVEAGFSLEAAVQQVGRKTLGVCNLDASLASMLEVYAFQLPTRVGSGAEATGRRHKTIVGQARNRTAQILSERTAAAALPTVATPTASLNNSPVNKQELPTPPMDEKGYLSPIELAIKAMKEEINPKIKLQECAKTLHLIFNNVLNHPTNRKYRMLKKDNRRFYESVGQHRSAITLLHTCGWLTASPVEASQGNGSGFELPSNASLQLLRDALPFLEELASS